VIGLSFPKITNKDFHIFSIDGLEPRMEALKKQVRPKFERMGETISSFLTTQLGKPVHTHVAKHARRTVHAPEETWVAWSTNKRGYKAHPHFQIGIRDTHLFAWFALIYECEQKKTFANNFLEDISIYTNDIPTYFYISEDHTKPDATLVAEMKKDRWKIVMNRLASVKKAEFLCGLLIPRQEAITLTSATLQSRTEKAFHKLLPLYHLAFEKSYNQIV
jgi:uncharacterized protein YktB (UPF0637 family)